MMFSRRAFVVAPIVCALFVSLAVAQEELEDLVLPADDAPAPPRAGEPPLMPEVLVQPDEPPIIDEVEVRPARNPYNVPGSYPNLMQQEYEGLSSALRGTQSVFESSQATTIVTPQDLMERQPRTPIEAIEREVGIMVQRTGAGQASPFIRGLTGPQTLILIDGIRLNNSTFRYGPNQYFGTIDPGMIERIEVVRGPQSVLWGSDAIGGVINVVTRKTDPRFYQSLGGQFIERYATADNGSYTRLNVTRSSDGWGMFSGGSYGNFNDLYRGGGRGVQPFTDYSQYAGDIRLDHLIADNQLLTISLQHFEQMNVPRTDKWPGEARRFDPQQRDLAYLRYQATDLSGTFDTIEFTASYNRQKEFTKRLKPTWTAVRRAEFNVNTVGMNVVGARDLGLLGQITTGVDWYHDHVTAWKDVGPPQFPPGSYYERLGAFLQWEVDLTRRLRATTGVRYTNIGAGSLVQTVTINPFPPPPLIYTPLQIYPTFQNWSGMVGFSYEIRPDLRFVCSVAEGFRAPNLDELTSISDNVNEGIDIPNPNLAPETSYGYEVGLKFDYDRLRMQTFYFWTMLDDLIVRNEVGTIPNPSPPPATIRILQRQNVASAGLQGVELAAEYLATPEWSIFGNYTYIYGQDYTKGEPMSRIPPAQGVIGLRWRDREMRNWFDIYGWIAGRQSRLSQRDIRDSRIPPGGTPAYGIVNVNFGMRLRENEQIALGVENIFNEWYRVHGSGVDGAGTSGHFGYERFF